MRVCQGKQLLPTLGLSLYLIWYSYRAQKGKQETPMTFEEQIREQNAKLSRLRLFLFIEPVDRSRHKEKQQPADDDLSSQLQKMLEERRKEFEKAAADNDEEEDDDDSDWSFD